MEHVEIALLAVSIYEARHPRPTQVTCAQAAEMLGLSVKTMKRIMAAHGVIRNTCGLFSIEKIDLLRTKIAQLAVNGHLRDKFESLPSHQQSEFIALLSRPFFRPLLAGGAA